MKKTAFSCTFWPVITASFAGLVMAAQTRFLVSAQAAATNPAPPSASQAYITNTFGGEPAINVRTGPSTIVYPVPCGLLPFNASAPALGASPGHDWVEISFPACPGGVGWVYAANITLTGVLQVVEPPQTPTPLATGTIDPTMEAAFHVEPTVTRLPTFTPPPPLALPTFSDSRGTREGFPTGAAILALAFIGGLVLAVSFIGRR